MKVVFAFLAIAVAASQSAVTHSATTVAPSQTYGYAYKVDNYPPTGDIKEHHEPSGVVPVVPKIVNPEVGHVSFIPTAKVIPFQPVHAKADPNVDKYSTSYAYPEAYPYASSVYAYPYADAYAHPYARANSPTAYPFGIPIYVDPYARSAYAYPQVSSSPHSYPGAGSYSLKYPFSQIPIYIQSLIDKENAQKETTTVTPQQC